MRWHLAKHQALKGNLEDDGRWDIYDLDRAWKIWMLLENTEWKHLPDEGGLLDQEDALMADLATISFHSQVVEHLLKEDGKLGD